MDGEAARTCAQTQTQAGRIQDTLTGEGKESVEVCQKAFSQKPNKMERRPDQASLLSKEPFMAEAASCWNAAARSSYLAGA